MDPRLVNNLSTPGASTPGSSQKTSRPVLAVLDRSSLARYSGSLTSSQQQATLLALEPGGRALISVAGKELGVLFLGSSTLRPGDRFSVQLQMLPDMADTQGTNQPGKGVAGSAGVRSTLSSSALSLGALSKIATMQDAVVAVASASISEAKTQIAEAIRSGVLAGTASMNLIDALGDFLSGSVERSGLFYESHLKEVALGRRNAKLLLQEPQALSEDSQQIDEEAFALSRSSAGPLPVFPTPEKLSGFVSKQLAALFDHSFSLLISGLFSEPISIFFEKDGPGSSVEDAAPAWQVTVETMLESLGVVRFQVKNYSSGWDITLWAESQEVGFFRSKIPPLLETLGALNVPVLSLNIQSLVLDDV